MGTEFRRPFGITIHAMVNFLASLMLIWFWWNLPYEVRLGGVVWIPVVLVLWWQGFGLLTRSKSVWEFFTSPFWTFGAKWIRDYYKSEQVCAYFDCENIQPHRTPVLPKNPPTENKSPEDKPNHDSP